MAQFVNISVIRDLSLCETPIVCWAFYIYLQKGEYVQSPDKVAYTKVAHTIVHIILNDFVNHLIENYSLVQCNV